MRCKKINITELECVSDKLKHIRDKTHFHIDADGMLDTKAVWEEANLSGKELSAAIDAVWAILKNLELLLHLPEVTLLDYDSQIARRIAIAVEEGSDF